MELASMMTEFAQRAVEHGSGTAGGGHDHGQKKMPMPSGASNAVNGSSNPHMNHNSDHLMSPYLFGYKKDFFILFREAKITSAGALAAAIIVSFFFAALASMFMEASKGIERKAILATKRLSVIGLLGALSFGFRMFLHYIAMLIVMTMNIWIILAVVIGHAVGYFFYNLVFRSRQIAEKNVDSSHAAC